jgi:hypothetical protein
MIEWCLLFDEAHVNLTAVPLLGASYKVVVIDCFSKHLKGESLANFTRKNLLSYVLVNKSAPKNLFYLVF